MINTINEIDEILKTLILMNGREMKIEDCLFIVLMLI